MKNFVKQIWDDNKNKNIVKESLLVWNRKRNKVVYFDKEFVFDEILLFFG